MNDSNSPPAGPEPRWTSSAKSGVGTSVNPRSPLWFTLSHGIVNEVYYPRLDQANIRDLGLIVTSGTEFFSEEKRHADPVLATSCARVGLDDGWQDLKENKRLTNDCHEVRDGNLALTAELGLPDDGGCVLVLAFGSNAVEAGERARASLLDPLEGLLRDYVAGWQDFQSNCLDLTHHGDAGPDFYRISAAVMKTHQSKYFVGGMTASLSIPWGFSKGDNDLGGYHLVWPRDQVESAGALLACGDTEGARGVLRYLLATQEADGHWAQNMWLDGTPYWNGVQIDETAFPILLADAFEWLDAGRWEGTDFSVAVVAGSINGK